jgi:hypothetical protein
MHGPSLEGVLGLAVHTQDAPHWPLDLEISSGGPIL